MKFEVILGYGSKEPFIYELTDMRSFVNCFEPNSDWKAKRARLEGWAKICRIGDELKVTHAFLTRIE